MNTTTRTWLSISGERSSSLRCAECGDTIELGGPSLDHHPRVCPACGVECVYLDSNERIVQIVLKNAPPVLIKAIRILQQQFDELEYVELLVAVEELADGLANAQSGEANGTLNRSSP